MPTRMAAMTAKPCPALAAPFTAGAAVGTLAPPPAPLLGEAVPAPGPASVVVLVDRVVSPPEPFEGEGEEGAPEDEWFGGVCGEGGG